MYIIMYRCDQGKSLGVSDCGLLVLAALEGLYIYIYVYVHTYIYKYVSMLVHYVYCVPMRSGQEPRCKRLRPAGTRRP